jgi:hypothetical protein
MSDETKKEEKMSDSYGCEEELMRIVELLRQKANELEEAAESLKALRDNEFYKSEIENAVNRAKEWAKRFVK